MIQSSFTRNIIEVGRLMREASDPQQILTISLDFAIELSKADEGTLIICRDESGQYLGLSRDKKGQSLKLSDSRLETRIFRDLLSVKDEYVSFFDSRDMFMEFQAEFQKKYHLSQLMVFPLIAGEKLCGVLFISRRKSKKSYDDETLAGLQNFADFLSLQIPALMAEEKINSEQRINTKMWDVHADFGSIIGSHPKLLDVLQVVTQVAETNVPVLIEGETGTGKELIARAIHNNSQRRKKKMVSLNCGAFPENLLESEFFGYKKGAFTGAVRDHRGKFEAADGGTIFLDEVDEMNPLLQVKLLRILQWGEFSPLGSDEVKRVDVRIVAASKQDLKEMVQNGTFRDDLYYRLNLIKLELPPLRDRREDILQLANYFLNQKSDHHPGGLRRISADAQRAIQAYNYPGNVRELENIIQRAAILCQDDTIHFRDLPEEIRTFDPSQQDQEIDFQEPFKKAKRRILENFEKAYLQNMLEKNDGVVSRAARNAGMHEKNFREKMKYYQIQP